MLRVLRYPTTDLLKSGAATAVYFNVSQETVRELIVRQLEQPERTRVPGVTARDLIRANAGTLPESSLFAMWKSAGLPASLLKEVQPQVRDGESEQRAAEEILKSSGVRR